MYGNSNTYSNKSLTRPAETQTTAARAAAQQPGVAGTAEHAKGVAEHAATVAHERGPGATGDLKDTIPALQAKTGAAVEQGKADPGQLAALLAVSAGAAKAVAKEALAEQVAAQRPQDDPQDPAQQTAGA